MGNQTWIQNLQEENQNQTGEDPHGSVLDTADLPHAASLKETQSNEVPFTQVSDVAFSLIRRGGAALW